MEENNTIQPTKKGSLPMMIVAVCLIIAAIGAFVYFKKDDVPVATENQNTTTVGSETPSEEAQVPPPPAPSPTAVPSPTQTPVVAPTPVATPTPAPVTTPTPVATTYKDGMYSSKGSYSSPAGGESINITLVIKDDTITAASGAVLATNPTSKNFQEKFLSGFAAQVVGKKLADVMVTKVSGSSLTPKGFTDAVTKIKMEAAV